jgi:hypothetical protein
MANTNTPYIAKAAASLANPITTAVVFQQTTSPIATVAATQTAKAVFVKYNGYSQYGVGVSNNVDLVRILVTAAGRATGGTTVNFTPSLLIAPAAANTGISLTLATNTTLYSPTAMTFNSASGNWCIKCELLWDPISGRINGVSSGYGGGSALVVTAAAAITQLTGYTQTAPVSSQSYSTAVTIPAPTGEMVLYFGAAGIFSTTDAGNIAYLDLLQVEEL